jgi:hypothetical protein
MRSFSVAANIWMVSSSQHTARGLDNRCLKDKLGALYAMTIAATANGRRFEALRGGPVVAADRNPRLADPTVRR